MTDSVTDILGYMLQKLQIQHGGLCQEWTKPIPPSDRGRGAFGPHWKIRSMLSPVQAIKEFSNLNIVKLFCIAQPSLENRVPPYEYLSSPLVKTKASSRCMHRLAQPDTVPTGPTVDVGQDGGWLVVLVFWAAYQCQHWLCIYMEESAIWVKFLVRPNVYLWLSNFFSIHKSYVSVCMQGSTKMLTKIIKQLVVTRSQTGWFFNHVFNFPFT